MKIRKPNFTKKRNFKYGAVATAITVGFVALVVVVNIIATLLLDKYPLTLDLTNSGRYEISQESIDYVSSLSRDVTIYVLADETYFSDPSNPYVYQVGETLKKYAQYSDRVTLSFIDLESNPGFASRYPSETFAVGDILVESDLRIQKFSYQDLFDIGYNSSTGSVSSVSSHAEETMTSALLYVTDEDPTGVAVTEGHGENAVAGLTGLLGKNGFELETVRTLGAEISPDAQIVIVAAPTIDFTEEEIKKLDSFLVNGGAYGKQLIYIADPGQPKLPNLETFLAEWGIGFEEGVVVETDANRIYYNAYFSIQNADSLDLDFIGRTEALKAPIVMYNVRPVVTLFDAQNLRSTKVLCTTYDSSVLAPLNIPDGYDPSNEQKQVFNTIVAGQRESDATAGGEVTRSTVVAFASSNMFASGIGDSETFGNSQYIVSLFNEMTGKEAAITVASKDLSAVRLEINATTAIVLGVVFVAVLPLAVLVIGLVVFLRRRNL